MARGNNGGAGKVHADTIIGELSKRPAYNQTASRIGKFTVVSLREAEGSRGPGAHPAQGSSPALSTGVWALTLGSMGTKASDKRGYVADWAVLTLDTSSKDVDDLVYVDDASPGALTLVPGAFTTPVGVVLSKGTEGRVLVQPEMFRHRYGSMAKVADVADTATYAAADLLRGSGGLLQLSVPAGAETRTLPNPLVSGQELAITAIADAGGSIAITNASGLDGTGGGNNTLTFNAVEQLIMLKAFAVAGASTLRWRITLNDGSVGLS